MVETILQFLMEQEVGLGGFRRFVATLLERTLRQVVPTFTSLALLAGLTDVAAAQEVPASWSRYTKRFTYENEETKCTGSVRTSWILTLDGGKVLERAVPTEDVRNHRDALPYDILFHPSMLGPYPPPEGYSPPELEEAAARRRMSQLRRTVVRADDGWLIAFDAGEFGGSLWWYPHEPGAGSKLLDENLLFLTRHPRSGEIFAATGGWDGMNILVVEHGDRAWGVRQVAHFDLRPGDFGIQRAAVSETPDEDLIVAHETMVVRIRAGGRTEVMATMDGVPDWVDSVVLAPSGDLFIGLRFFVLRLRRTPDGTVQEYYVPRGCQRYHYEPLVPANSVDECVCDGGVAEFRVRHHRRQR